jgi:hypothetical protein
MLKQGIIKRGGGSVRNRSRSRSSSSNYVLSTFGKIVKGNVFRLTNTCIENARELEVIDNIDTNRFTAADYIALVHKLLKDSELQRLVLQQQHLSK